MINMAMALMSTSTLAFNVSRKIVLRDWQQDPLLASALISILDNLKDFIQVIQTLVTT